MKKYKIVLFVCFFVSSFFLFNIKDAYAKNVAKTCIYDDAYQNNNEANHSVKLEIYDDNSCSAWITMFDGKSMNNKEKCQDWKGDVQRTYSIKGECPTYALAVYKRFAILSAKVYVSYDFNTLEENLKLQPYPAVILRSTDYSSEEEPIKNCRYYKTKDSCPAETDYGRCRWNSSTKTCDQYYLYCEDYPTKVLCPSKDSEGNPCVWNNEDGCIVSDETSNNNNDEEDDEKDPSSEVTPPDYKVDNDASIGGMCSMPQFRKPMKFLGSIVWLFKILVPIIIIGFGILDFYKAVTGSKEDALKKAFQSIMVRVIAGVFVFLLPGLIQFVLNMINEWSEYQNDWCCCTECLLNPSCNVDACDSASCHIEGTN